MPPAATRHHVNTTAGKPTFGTHSRMTAVTNTNTNNSGPGAGAKKKKETMRKSSGSGPAVLPRVNSSSTITAATTVTAPATARNTTPAPTPTPTKHRSSKSTSTLNGRAGIQTQVKAPEVEDGDDDEWVSSSGADTPSSIQSTSEGKHEEVDEDETLKMRLREREKEREKEVMATPKGVGAGVEFPVTSPLPSRRREESEGDITPAPAKPPLPPVEPSNAPTPPPPPPTKSNCPPPAPIVKQQSQPQLQTQPHTQTQAPKKQHLPPSPARSQPDLHTQYRTPTSPTVAQHRAKTRPPSVRSTASTRSRPHPLIRGKSHTVSGLGLGMEELGKAGRAEPVVTSGLDRGGAGGEGVSPTSRSEGNRMSSSSSSGGSARTLPLLQPGPAGTFTLSPPTTEEDRERDRNRTMSSASTASLTKALSSLARQASPQPPTHHLPPSHSHSFSAGPGNRSTWHFPSLSALAAVTTPAPSRPSTPPPLVLHLPKERYQPTDSDGGRRYRNHLKRKGKGGEEEELEDERGEEGVGEWIPWPYFGEHWGTVRSARSGGAGESVLRQSWRRVCAARTGAAAH